MKQGRPNAVQSHSCALVRRMMTEATVYLCFDGIDFPEAKAFIKNAEEAWNRVKGNRPLESVVSWSDLRLLMAAHCRVCLEHLEAAHD